MGIYTDRITDNLENINILIESILRSMNKQAIKEDELYTQLGALQTLVETTRQLHTTNRG